MKNSPVVLVYGGVSATCYFLDKGEKISRHQHGVPHSTSVIRGRSAVDIFDGRETLEMDRHSALEVLPPYIDHEITALEDGTIIVNMMEGAFYSSPDLPKAGGVLMTDGTVVYQ